MSQTVKFKGTTIAISGQFPNQGDVAKPFSLVAKDLSDKTLADYKGQRKVLNIFPSVDTSVCAMSVRAFNQSASDLKNTVVLCISADLPFAQARFCGAEGLNNVVMLSTLRGEQFKQDYGVAIAEGPMVGLTTRAVIVLDENDHVLYSQLVDEVTHEPNYDAALKSLA